MIPNMCDPHIHAMNVGLVEEALEAGRLRDCEDVLDYMDAVEGGWKMACAKRFEADDAIGRLPRRGSRGIGGET